MKKEILELQKKINKSITYIILLITFLLIFIYNLEYFSINLLILLEFLILINIFYIMYLRNKIKQIISNDKKMTNKFVN